MQGSRTQGVRMQGSPVVGLVALAAAVVLAGCTAGNGSPSDSPSPSVAQTTPAEPAPTSPPPSELDPLAAYAAQQLQWTGCGGGFECAQLRVPVDYADPRLGRDFSIDVIRLPTDDEGRLGSLLVNPGGPGGSGVSYARSAQVIVSEEVRRAYDIVGFDPRGVAGSDPVECLTDTETDELIATDPTPDDEAEIQQLLGVAADVGEQCSRRSPQTYRWVDTVSAARDMDILRSALGEARLNLLGKSYGSMLGAVYAEQFPATVGRLVLDGALPPQLTSEEISRGQAAGFETALHRFAADCLTISECPLTSDSPAGGVAEVQDFLADLESDPLPAGEGRTLTQALGATSVLYHLYSPPRDWALLRAGLEAGFDGDGSVLIAMLDQRLQRDPRTGAYATNAQEAFYAVSCLDQGTSTVEQIREQSAQWAVESPTFGPFLAWSNAVCAQWPVPPVSQPREIAAAGAAPILVVSTQYDPATLYEWGVLMAGTFADAALVSFNGDGHTGYRHGSECVDQAVDEYLLQGLVPAEDPRCGY